jgi:3-deoxy-D-manno-octulosonate 8-phosphate phosphatase (KDO 8-P phosphatase)
MPVLVHVGLAVCPADAVTEVKNLSHLVTQAAGGRGAVREVIEIILKAQERWNELIGDVKSPSSNSLP